MIFSQTSIKPLFSVAVSPFITCAALLCAMLFAPKAQAQNCPTATPVVVVEAGGSFLHWSAVSPVHFYHLWVEQRTSPTANWTVAPDNHFYVIDTAWQVPAAVSMAFETRVRVVPFCESVSPFLPSENILVEYEAMSAYSAVYMPALPPPPAPVAYSGGAPSTLTTRGVIELDIYGMTANASTCGNTVTIGQGGGNQLAGLSVVLNNQSSTGLGALVAALITKPNGTKISICTYRKSTCGAPNMGGNHRCSTAIVINTTTNAAQMQAILQAALAKGCGIEQKGLSAETAKSQTIVSNNFLLYLHD